MAFHAPVQRQATLYTAIFLIALTLILSYSDTTRPYLHTCYIHREYESPASTWISLGDTLLHNLSVYCIWSAFLLLSFILPDTRRSLYSLFYSAAWFQGTYWLLDALKAPMYDFNCAGKNTSYPNAISGHYCYFTFVSLTAPVLANAIFAGVPAEERSRKRTQVASVVAGTLVLAYVIGSVATLYRTYAHGYHSPQQILFGTALGCFSHVGLEIIHYSDQVFRGRGPEREKMEMTLLAVKVVGSLALYLWLWPAATAGPAITPIQYLFHLFLWVIIALTSQHYQTSSRSVSSS